MAALKTYGQVGGPGLEKGEGRVWGHQDMRDVGAERQIKKKVQMRGNGEGAKGTCGAPAFQGSADKYGMCSLNLPVSTPRLHNNKDFRV